MMLNKVVFNSGKQKNAFDENFPLFVEKLDNIFNKVRKTTTFRKIDASLIRKYINEYLTDYVYYNENININWEYYVFNFNGKFFTLVLPVYVENKYLFLKTDKEGNFKIRENGSIFTINTFINNMCSVMNINPDTFEIIKMKSPVMAYTSYKLKLNEIIASNLFYDNYIKPKLEDKNGNYIFVEDVLNDNIKYAKFIGNIIGSEKNKNMGIDYTFDTTYKFTKIPDEPDGDNKFLYYRHIFFNDDISLNYVNIREMINDNVYRGYVYGGQY